MFDIRVVSVKPLDNCKLFVRFNNRIEKEYDVKNLFEELDYMTVLEHNKQLFESVKVDVKGHAVYWNEDLDIPAYELWENGVTIFDDVKIVERTLFKNGDGRFSSRVAIPLAWLKSIGVTEENQSVNLKFDGDKIIIQKIK